MAGGRHPCIRRGCRVMVPGNMLVCDPHWVAVPEPLRVAMVDAIGRHGADSVEYDVAVAAVVDWARTGVAS